MPGLKLNHVRNWGISTSHKKIVNTWIADDTLRCREGNSCRKFAYRAEQTVSIEEDCINASRRLFDIQDLPTALNWSGMFPMANYWLRSGWLTLTKFVYVTRVLGRLWQLSHWPLADAAVTWWRHQMETFSALLALYAGNSPVTGEFSTQRPVTRSFDVFLWSASELTTE